MHDHIRGNPNAGAVLIEYADFECPYCGMAEPYVRAAAERYKDDMALVFRVFPLAEIHPHAMHAAQAAEAAGLQGKFWEMHDLLYANQSRLDDEDLFEYASTLGLDVERFKRDFSSRAVIDAIELSIKRGLEDGIPGTPSFFLNGNPLELDDYDDLERAIANTIKERART